MNGDIVETVRLCEGLSGGYLEGNDEVVFINLLILYVYNL